MRSNASGHSEVNVFVPLTGISTGTRAGRDNRRLSSVNMMMSSNHSDSGGRPSTHPSLSSQPSSAGSSSHTVTLDGVTRITHISARPLTPTTVLGFA